MNILSSWHCSYISIFSCGVRAVLGEKPSQKLPSSPWPWWYSIALIHTNVSAHGNSLKVPVISILWHPQLPNGLWHEIVGSCNLNQEAAQFATLVPDLSFLNQIRKLSWQMYPFQVPLESGINNYVLLQEDSKAISTFLLFVTMWSIGTLMVLKIWRTLWNQLFVAAEQEVESCQDFQGHILVLVSGLIGLTLQVAGKR